MKALTRELPEWKVKLVDELAEQARRYRTILIADVTGIPASHIQMLRKKLHGKAVLKVVKPKLLGIALRKAGIDSSLFEGHLTGQLLAIFTDLNPFELTLMMDKLVTRTYFKPGEKTPVDIVIPEGNTGIPPGPMLSVFGKLKIPTKVQGNVIYVAKDTTVAKSGDVVSSELASLLQKLGLALKEIKLRPKLAYDGILIPGDKLILNLKEYEDEVASAHLDALKIAVEIALPDPAVLPLTISRAHRQAVALAVEAGFTTPETIEAVLLAAIAKANALAAEVARLSPELGIEVKQAPATPAASTTSSEKKGEEKEESKELSEEALSEGFSALFG
ncbi:MAG: 50S ribosomal protein L10 [Desulfurococcus sp.]|nr:50S ribosomal protein L10 [Desulfurococcus sp.]